VEADRGEDIGIVSEIFCCHASNQSVNLLAGVLRHATAEEKYLLPIKEKEEWSAVQVIYWTYLLTQ
jgi:hypothetical protein